MFEKTIALDSYYPRVLAPPSLCTCVSSLPPRMAMPHSACILCPSHPPTPPQEQNSLSPLTLPPFRSIPPALFPFHSDPKVSTCLPFSCLACAFPPVVPPLPPGSNLAAQLEAPLLCSGKQPTPRSCPRPAIITRFCCSGQGLCSPWPVSPCCCSLPALLGWCGTVEWL